ncbi:hypothetical protein ACFX13_014595 [Malus domestica]
MDELLAVLGYKVRSDDITDVAEKLEQLEMVRNSAQEDGISQLFDTVHYIVMTGGVGEMYGDPLQHPQVETH